MSRLPFQIDNGLDGEIIVIAEGRAQVQDIVSDVASQVPPNVIANIARIVHEYHEHGGPALAAELALALENISERAVIRVANLSPTDAWALGIALQRYATVAFESPEAPEVDA